ncbi:MAG TPA: DNA translocase FtsK 4TM domain-containing protein [Candidatus Polarisedimenticolia bacterium]|nr:DNA translocase FtsK 4TM domain-containing protein [Candidatus Polarisedimenticolia bacterium]
MEPRIRDEIGAIAVVAFALLSTVALATDQGAVLQWWRSALFALLGWAAWLVPLALAGVALELWFGFIRRETVLPILGGVVVVFALLGLTRHYVRDDVAGGFVGGALAKAAAGLFGDIGAPIALGALLLVGVVIAANRTIADLWKPVWRQRPDIGGLKPGTLIPGGTATRFDRFLGDDTDEPDAEPVRIHIPEEKPIRKVAAAPAQLPKPSLPGGAGTLTGPSATAGRGPSEVGPAPSHSDRVPFAVSTAGLASAAVVAEGVLHADPPERAWVLPAIDELDQGSAARSGKDELLRNQRVIEETLSHFGISARIVDVFVGPVVTRYELKPAAGVKLSRIEALADDLALALAARTLRIEAPIPGKSVVGIEIPNLAIGLVSVRDVAESAEFKGSPSKLTVALGKDVAGGAIVTDLAKLPHLLIAGQTGSGKSVCIGAILTSLLLQATPDEVRILIGDLKRVDFPGFNGVPHLVVPVMHDSPQILNALYWTTSEMDRRYRLFARANARNIASYNEKHTGQDRVPYVVFIIDELADLMLQAPIQVEKQITRIAQLARATGIHLVLGTQRPSVDVITGLIKANVPARIAFATASAVDSRTIIDMTGAEKLLGRGDMLWLAPDAAKPVRAQGAFVSDAEIEQVIRHWRQQREAQYDMSILEDKERARVREDGGDEIDDDRYEEAVEIVQRAGQASVSMLQRKMTIGFARAGRLIDIMEQNGVIGPSQGPGKMREVYGMAKDDA